MLSNAKPFSREPVCRIDTIVQHRVATLLNALVMPKMLLAMDVRNSTTSSLLARGPINYGRFNVTHSNRLRGYCQAGGSFCSNGGLLGRYECWACP